MLFIFPADPERTRMLKEEERKLAIARLYADQPSVSRARLEVIMILD